jgi:hypothetical protein
MEQPVIATNATTTVSPKTEAPEFDYRQATEITNTPASVRTTPTTSESFRYSSTPNKISDLTRFLPALPTKASTTTTP